MPTWRLTTRSRRRAAVAVLPVLGLIGAAAALVSLSQSGSTTSSPDLQPSPASTARGSATASLAPTSTPIAHAGILDGVPMTGDEWEARKDLLPLALMVDNAPAAFPHSGLDRADLVYEAFVEGGITRFMAVFWRREAEIVEPIRSARTPFVIWADELGALYGHAGGAETDNDADAIGQIAEWKVPDLNAFAPVSDEGYYRDNARYSPHNLVANSVSLRLAATALGFSGPPRVETWPFKRDGEGNTSAQTVKAVELDFQEQRYPFQVVQWHWDPTANEYLRFQSGGPHVDGQTGQQLRFKNLVIMRVPWQVADESGHVLLDEIGEGPASVFLDGKMVEATWRKRDRRARTRFYDSRNVEIAFNRGPIFIEVVGPESPVITGATVADLPPIPPYEPPGSAAGPSKPGESPTPVIPSTTETPAGATPSATTTPSAGGTPSPSPSASALPPSPTGTPRPSPTPDARPGQSATP